MRQDTEDSLQRIRDVGLRAKSGIQYDVPCSFDLVKIQLHTKVGDCRAAYTLYVTTVRSVCDEAVRPFEFIKENLKAWTKMRQDMEDFIKRIRDVGFRAKSDITYDVVDFFEHVKIQEFIKTNVKAWDKMHMDLQLSMKRVQDVGLGARNGFLFDISQLFDHIKAQVCTTVGDCRAFYGLYSSTLNPLCNQGVRLYEFIKESVKSWTNVCQDIDASTKRIRDLSLRAKSGMTYDVARFFEDVKIEASRKKGSVAPDLLFPLVLQSPGPVIFAVFALLLTVAVPLCGLAVLRKRCRERPQQKETSFICPPDSVGKTMFSLWILAVCLTARVPQAHSRGLQSGTVKSSEPLPHQRASGESLGQLRPACVSSGRAEHQ
ncbi:uncharacterized protein [Dermacentor albipictus]|uniref:uncharacterized protein isoform X2 n=1 Tax=Dermacentor albipictus TaxID=60249 RepID=UPI0038FCC415